MKRTKGFAWAELFIVLCILGSLAAVVLPNVVGLLERGEHKHIGDGTYYVYEKDGCQLGNWTIEGRAYKSFCPDIKYTYRYFCQDYPGSFYPCQRADCTSPPEYVYLGNNEIAAYCQSCRGNVTPCEDSK